MLRNKIRQVEEYAAGTMASEVAHDFKHVDRVRSWALQIAREEGYEDLEVVEIAALLHDIGLGCAEKRSMHGQIGAEMAARFLRDNNLFPEERIEEIANAIRFHNSNREGSGKLLGILRDADMIDAFGAVGIMRAFTSKSSKPEYDPQNVKGDTWGISARGIDERFDRGLGVGDYIVDQINFQISYYDNLTTRTAKRLAKPLVEFMKDYIVRLEAEINAGAFDRARP